MSSKKSSQNHLPIIHPELASPEEDIGPEEMAESVRTLTGVVERLVAKTESASRRAENNFTQLRKEINDIKVSISRLERYAGQIPSIKSLLVEALTKE